MVYSVYSLHGAWIMYIRMRVTQAYTRGAMTRYARVYQSYPYRATVAPWVEVARCSTCAWLRARVHKTLCVHWIRPRAAFTRRRRDTGQSIPICFRFRHPLRAPPSYVPGISMIFAWKQIYLASFPPHPTVDFQFLPWIPWGRSTANILVALSTPLSPSTSMCFYLREDVPANFIPHAPQRSLYQWMHVRLPFIRIAASSVIEGCAPLRAPSLISMMGR